MRHATALFCLFDQVFKVTGSSSAIRVPPWIFQLPLSRLKHFLEGYREGAGTHTGYPECRELAFNTVGMYRGWIDETGRMDVAIYES